MTNATTPDDPSADGASPVPVLLRPRDELGEIVSSSTALDACLSALAAGSGPFALDVERAGGYRYTQRAYLLQIRRADSGTWLIDPLAFDSFDDVAEVLSQAEWVLHAANQDLPSLTELGLRAPQLFDTELAGRLVGLERVGLAAMTERYLGYSLAKAHSAADWSTRPLPADWLTYAALDVEPLLELRERLTDELAAKGRLGWATEEFEWVLNCPAPEPRVDPWRRVKGMTKRSPRALAIARELWLARDEMARERDRAPSRVLPDSAIATMAAAPPESIGDVRRIGPLRRQPDAQLAIWLAAVDRARHLPTSELPDPRPSTEGTPNHRSWDRINPLAAQRLARVRNDLAALSEQLLMPRENIISPAVVRDVVWAASGGAHVESAATPSADELAASLRDAGARPWQVNLISDLMAESIAQADSDETQMDAADDEPEITRQ